MSLFGNVAFDNHEQISFFSDLAIGFRAVIAIHRTGPLGTAGGGCRIWPYAHETDAVRDALRLSRAMTYKLALIEIPVGGAKAVVIADPARDKSEALLTALGGAIDRMGGRFIASEDVGTGPADLAVIARSTPWVNLHAPGADNAGATAYGVVVGLRAAVRRRLGRGTLEGVTIAVQGLGRVGHSLCRQLAAAGARLTVTDLDRARVDAVVAELGAQAVPPETIFDREVDVFSPCALGDVLDDTTVPRLRCAIVGGSANNPLAHPALADLLGARGILYAPDIAISAGGVLGAAGGDERVVRGRLDTIGALLEGIFARAERDRSSTHAAAEQIARERLVAMGGRP
ncbi:MAG: amino acid dehydrogenase [Myxococcales bacterium]|nr:amino acid dehydrogenase [Myxococcales bacterium]